MYTYIYIRHPVSPPGLIPEYDGWGEFEEYDPTTVHRTETPEIYSVPNSPEIPSPELSPSDEEVMLPALVPPVPPVLAVEPVSDDEGDDEGDDEVPVPPVAPAVALFDESPAIVMIQSLHQHPRQELWCLHCDVRFHYVSEAITHYETARHLRTVAFMMGQPQFYCVICARVPARPYAHEVGPRHIRRRARLNLPPHPNHVALRQVRVCPRIRTRCAFLLP
jgi:hypothetical protein